MNRANECKFIFDIEVYPEHGKDYWAQALFLVHGYNDVLWTDDINKAVSGLKKEIGEYFLKEHGIFITGEKMLNKLLYVEHSDCRLSETKIAAAVTIYVNNIESEGETFEKVTVKKIITYAGVIDFNDIAPIVELKLCEVKNEETPKE